MGNKVYNWHSVDTVLKAFSHFNISDNQDDTIWCKKYIATQLLKLWKGYHISYSQMEICRTLGLVNSSRKPNASGRDFIFEVFYDRDFS